VDHAPFVSVGGVTFVSIAEEDFAAGWADQMGGAGDVASIVDSCHRVVSNGDQINTTIGNNGEEFVPVVLDVNFVAVEGSNQAHREDQHWIFRC